MWRLLFVAGAAIAAAGFLAASALHLALTEGVHHHIAPAAAQALNEFDAYDYLPFSIGIAIMLRCSRLGIPRRGLERVLGWSALVLGIGAFTPVGLDVPRVRRLDRRREHRTDRTRRARPVASPSRNSEPVTA